MTRQLVGFWPSDTDPEVIAAAFQQSLQKSAPDDGQFRMRSVVKSTATKVFGWASIAFTSDGKQVVDLQGHLIDVDELENAAYKFVAKMARPSGEMHKSAAKGRLVESMVVTPEKLEAWGLPPGSMPLGWWVGFEMPPDVIAKVVDGTYGMFSIEGRGVLDPIEDD